MLKSAVKINELFTTGQTAKKYPVLIKYLVSNKSDDGPIVQFLFSVSKRNIRNAVDRNKMKRRMREALRDHKPELMEWVNHNSLQLKIGFVFTGKEVVGLDIVALSLEKSLVKMKGQIDGNSPKNKLQPNNQ